MSEIQLLDTETVLNIDLKGLKLIEASAGTGKTYTIANLYLRHILEGRMPSQILVVTFTNAATEELRGRIRDRLFQALELLLGRQSFDDEFLVALSAQFQSFPAATQKLQKQRLRHALAMMDQSAISTIHSFCQQVIQNHALAGLQYFDNEIIKDEREYWTRAMNDWWRRHTYRLNRWQWLMFNNAIRGYHNFCARLSQIRVATAASLLPSERLELTDLFAGISALEPALSELCRQWIDHFEFINNAIRNSEALSRKKELPYHGSNIDSFLETMDGYFRSDCRLPVPDKFTYLSYRSLNRCSKASKRGMDGALDHAFFHAVAAVDDKLNSLLGKLCTTILRNAFEDCSSQVRIEKQDNRSISYQDLIDFILQALDSDVSSGLAAIIRRQYPVAMIDEFQDTDDAQYRIFSAIYFNNEDISLTLIGDPKQSIYSFRGGDIFTYIQARQAAGMQKLALATNWRSQPDLVKAVNHFFLSRSDAFIFSDSIQFLPVKAVDRNSASVLTIDSETQAAMTIWQIPSDSGNKPMSREKAGELLNNAVAAEIVSLLSGRQNKRVKVNQKTLKAGDIAILVRTSAQGESIRKTLHTKGISAVTIGKDSVFDSDEASGLWLLLDAIAHPQDHSILRRSPGSSLLNFSYRQMLEIAEDEMAWQQWAENIQQLHNVWLSRGFIAMFQQMIQTFSLADCLATDPQADRRLTNLLHLGELLQQQSLKCSGMDNLLNWLFQQRRSNGSEDAELRLESDDSLVKIITIHKSKGLEFPVVFLPYLWTCYPVNQKQKQAVYFHNDHLQPVLDLGSDHIDHHCLLADRERLAEDIRLLYVALTRARSKVYLAWGEAGSRGRPGNSSETAIAYLLHSKQTPVQLSLEAVKGFSDPKTLTTELASFVDSAGGNIELRNLPLTHADAACLPGKQPDVTLQTREYNVDGRHSWRISSFSALTQDVHQPSATSHRDPRGDTILNFPAGSQVGLFLHCLFEHLDFRGDIDSQCLALIPRFAPRFGISLEQKIENLIFWINEIVGTALGEPGLKLGAISMSQRLNELAFDFAVNHVNIGSINRFFRARPNPPHLDVSAHDFRGLITGIIDVVFEYQGRYYLADYKSNYLGNTLEDYSRKSLQQAMLDRRYDLQLFLYSLALHRYLRQRIVDYRFEDHFGGAYYLFLRGMRQNTRDDYGVYFECPTQAEIESFDELLGYQSTEAGL